MNPRVLVVDYGLGNLHSVVKAFAHVGADVDVSSDPDAVRAASHLVLPGVGAFADGMNGLATRALVEPILSHIRAERPFFGICLGMQLLLGEGLEFGCHDGLRVIEGSVVEISAAPGIKVPHVGWNEIEPSEGRSDWTGTALAGLETSRPMVYFVHSFNAQPSSPSDRLADAWYGGVRICAAVAHGNAVATQFHPEKSGEVGLSILRRFVEG